MNKNIVNLMEIINNIKDMDCTSLKDLKAELYVTIMENHDDRQQDALLAIIRYTNTRLIALEKKVANG